MQATLIWPLLVVTLVTAQHVREEQHEWLEEDLNIEEFTHERSRRDLHYEPDEEAADSYEEKPVYRTKRYVEDEGHERIRRDAYYEPEEEYVRVKRRCDEEPVYRVKRSDYTRRPRQVHQYEVNEFTDDSSVPSSPPYEEMLAASAEHYHRVYAAPGAPGAPAAARYLRPDVSAQPIPAQAYRPVPSYPSNPHKPVSYHNASPITVVPAPVNVLPPPANFVQVPVSVANPDSAQEPIPEAVFVASAPVSLPLKALADEDQAPASAAHHHHHQQHHKHAHAQGGGHKHGQHHHNQHGAKTSKGYHTDEHLEKGGKGHKTSDLHRKEFEEAQGKKKKHHDHADHKGNHQEEAHGHKGSKFDEKKGHKKGHKTKGYHNKYHKDEFHKEHKFYDDYHKSGEHHRYGKFNAKHASNESGKKKAHHVNAGHDFVERGKKGYSNKGHLDADHKGHKAKHGHEEHHQHHEQHAKKGGNQGGKQWAYEKKH